MKPSELQRTTRTKYVGATRLLSQKLKATDESVASEGEAMFGTEAKAAGAPMAHSSMQWNSKTSNDTSAQARCNRWALD